MSEPIQSTISPWMPEQDRIRLATLGKLAEECSELAGRAARCIIQGANEVDPDTGRTNAEELAREIADVEACIAMVEAQLDIVPDKSRSHNKIMGFCRWHLMISERG